jgi:uncharacterized membrane protein (DUF373 family)
MTADLMLAHLKRFERFIAWILSGLLVLVILLATLDLAVTLIKKAVYGEPHFLISVDQLLGVLGLFLIILLGLELLETVKAYLQDDLIHVEVVLMVAIIALVRKVIVLEFREPSPLVLVGIAALILSIAVSYRMIMHILRGGARTSSGNTHGEKR